MSRTVYEEDEDECFHDTLDRIVSSSCSCSEAEDDNDNYGASNPDSPNYASFSTPRFPMAVSKYDIWISEPASVPERRSRLLLEMGLSADPSMSRVEMLDQISTTSRQLGQSDFSRSASSARYLTDGGEPSGSSSATVRSKSDAEADCGDLRRDDQCNNYTSSVCSPSILSIHSVGETGSFVNSHTGVVHEYQTDNSNGSSVAGVALPKKPPTGKNGRKMGSDSVGLNGNLGSIPVGGGVSHVIEEPECNGSESVCDQECTIKNLDTGKEFVVKEIREDGMLNKLKEVGTGRQLTMEEFDICVGHSPIVQELMRRQNVEEGNKDNLDSHTNGINGVGLKSKKKGGWLKSIRSVASVMTGHKERRSIDERDTLSEKGGRRSSSATDDSQDVSFHGPERVRVRQYGKSCKELTAVYKSQEIQAHNGYIWTIKFSLDGRYLASAGEDCVIHVWKVVESERKGDLLMEKQEDGNLNLFFLANGSPEPPSLSPNVDSHPEKKRRGRSSISRKSVSLEQIMVPETVFALSEKPFCSFQGHLDDVLDLSWSKSQHLLSSSMDKTVRLWHLSSKSCLKVFSHSDYVTCIQFNPVDDRYFISGSLDAKVRIWSIPDRQVVDWNDLHEMVTAACYTPDGQDALVGTYKGSCRIYNTSENKLQRKGQVNLQNKKKKSQHKKITGFQFGPGSSTEVLITSSDSRIRVVDAVDLVHKFKGFHNTNSQISAAITTNGKYVVSASEDSYVYVWKYEAESRPSRSKGITVTHSYEHFHCQDVSVAIPWPGMGVEHPPTPVEDTSGNGIIYSATNNYLFDRISATWPEEKLVVAARNRSPRVSVDYSNQNMSAWGMVIVTAGLRGQIRTFQNFGLPVGSSIV